MGHLYSNILKNLHFCGYSYPTPAPRMKSGMEVSKVQKSTHNSSTTNYKIETK